MQKKSACMTKCLDCKNADPLKCGFFFHRGAAESERFLQKNNVIYKKMTYNSSNRSKERIYTAFRIRFCPKYSA